MITQAQRNVLFIYYKKRLESLNYCDSTFEDTLEGEKQSLVDGVNRGQIQPDAPELLAALSNANYLILPTFRNCMVIAVCTFLEDILSRIGAVSVADFEAQVKALRRKSQVGKYLDVLMCNLPIDSSPIRSNLRLIEDTVMVRNAIVHAWGKIDNCNDPDVLRTVIDRTNWAEETADGYILLDDAAYAGALIPIMKVAEYLLTNLPVSEE